LRGPGDRNIPGRNLRQLGIVIPVVKRSPKIDNSEDDDQQHRNDQRELDEGLTGLGTEQVLKSSSHRSGALRLGGKVNVNEIGHRRSGPTG